MKAYSIKEIHSKIKKLSSWSYKDNFLENNFEFKNFLDAMEFVNFVASYAEQQEHHPIILINYNKIKIKLRTNDINGISEKDFKLAKSIDHLLLKLFDN